MQTHKQLFSNETSPTVQNLKNSNFPHQFGKKVYHVESNLKVNWFRASNYCRQLGGHLWNIESREEMDAVQAKVPDVKYWTSANCLAAFREWISSSTGYPMPFLKWHPNEPNGKGDENCVELHKIGLNDINCEKALNSYICEAKYM